jgi:uncharacterized protein (TIGR01777 family)
MSDMKILVSGMSGPIGGELLPALVVSGNKVTRLVRRPPQSSDEIRWDPMRSIVPESVSGFDAVIHLAGESIVGRWTSEKKARMVDSRVQGTRHLAEALTRASRKPQVLITASAIGYYGDRGEETLTEESSAGTNFLAGVCQQWEAATSAAAQAGIRTVQVRIGVMLSTKGGALPKMVTPFKLGLGGRIGSGQQYLSWISIDDVVGVILYVLDAGQVRGPVNLTAPNPATNSEFTRTLAEVLHRPAIFPMPTFAVRALFGQMGDELLLASARVLPSKLQVSGYQFRRPELKTALMSLLKK